MHTWMNVSFICGKSIFILDPYFTKADVFTIPFSDNKLLWTGRCEKWMIFIWTFPLQWNMMDTYTVDRKRSPKTLGSSCSNFLLRILDSWAMRWIFVLETTTCHFLTSNLKSRVDRAPPWSRTEAKPPMDDPSSPTNGWPPISRTPPWTASPSSVGAIGSGFVEDPSNVVLVDEDVL